MRIRYIVVVPLVLLAGWIAADFTDSATHSLRQFDGHEVGRLETGMWRSYYDHHQVTLFGELVELLRDQYHVPFWKACLGAYHAARGAVVFQRGHNRGEFEQALPDIVSFYSLIRQRAEVPFDVDKASRLELEWWIIHRERKQHPPGDLEHALAALQAEIYQSPERLFTWHAKARAGAMLLRDERAEAGGVSGQDWSRIGALLDSSWTSLQAAVAGTPGVEASLAH